MKQIEGFEDYMIDENGDVYSCKNNKNKKITTHINSRGHHRVSVSMNGWKYTLDVHRLVYKHFVGDIPEGQDVYHIDGNRDNNHKDNLILKPHGRKKKS